MGNYKNESVGEAAARQREAQPGGRMMTGLFKDRESAEGAYRSLSSRGYGKDDVNLLMSDDTRKKYFSDKDVCLALQRRAVRRSFQRSCHVGAAGVRSTRSQF